MKKCFLGTINGKVYNKLKSSTILYYSRGRATITIILIYLQVSGIPAYETEAQDTNHNKTGTDIGISAMDATAENNDFQYKQFHTEVETSPTFSQI